MSAWFAAANIHHVLSSWINSAIVTSIAERQLNMTVVTMCLYVTLGQSIPQSESKCHCITRCLNETGMDGNSLSLNMTAQYQAYRGGGMDIAIDSISVFMIYSVTTYLLNPLPKQAVVMIHYNGAVRHSHLLPNSKLGCEADNIRSRTENTFHCPYSAPKKSHRLQIWGLQNTDIENVSMLYIDLLRQGLSVFHHYSC